MSWSPCVVGNKEEVWVSFKYECLPNICYWCGCLDHDDKDCEVWLNSEGSLTKEQRQFGPSICAPPFSPSQKSGFNIGVLQEQKISISSICWQSKGEDQPIDKAKQTLQGKSSHAGVGDTNRHP